jgi:signal transduction histidine kinase
MKTEVFNRLRIPLKVRLFLPVSLIIITVVTIMTIWFVNTSINAFDNQIENNLQLEVKTISKMFERESMLKLKNVQTNLKVANHLFYNYELKILNKDIVIEVENQKTAQKHLTKVKRWVHNGKELPGNNEFVDSLFQLLGGTITVFQKIDSGYVRVATNVLKDDGTRAIGTFIPNNSPVVDAINKGQTYFGRAFVVNDWYTTAYEPIAHRGEIIGMIYVGDKEKDLAELKRLLLNLKIGKSGYPFVFDKRGHMIIHPTMEGDTWSDVTFQNQIKSETNAVFPLRYNGKDKTIAYKYFEKFELYIAASIIKSIENRELIRRSIIGATTVSLVAILFLLGFLYFFTTDRLYRFFTALQISNKKLATAELALKQSEKLATMGQISAGIAHELNNPLGVITMYSNIILEELDKNDPMVQDIQLIVEQANRCKNIVGGLLNFARKSKMKPMEVNVIDFVKRSLESVVIPPNVKTDVSTSISDPIMMIDAEQMMQVFTNLEKNAVEAMPKGGKLTIGIQGDNESVIITFSDTGTGIAEENMEKLFTPFFTTKELGKGTGLGLPLVYGIVKMHKGKIDIESNTDESKGPTGTSFTLSIPRVS